MARPECLGHPAGPGDPMGETVYCDGSCRRVSLPRWSARCDCRNGHGSASGRCNARDVTDPTAKPGGAVLCESCRRDCGAR